MPFTCPKWECRREIPFSSRVDSCPECGTYLFLHGNPLTPTEEQLETKNEKQRKARKETKAYSRVTKPLNDAEIKALLEEEEKSWREPLDYDNFEEWA